MPIAPGLDAKSEQIQTNVGLRYQMGEVSRDFAAWESGLDSDARLDIHQEHSPNPDLWQQADVETTDVPVQRELSRSDELRLIIERAPRDVTLARIGAVSAAIDEGLRQQYQRTN